MRFFILLEGDILARMTDEAYMQRALELALQAEGNTSPNPMVGCVIVDAEGNIVGEGYHHKAGEPHAEVNALAEAKQMAQGATAYVTLEPCPMCAGAILNARVSRVYFGARDREMGACGGVMNLFMEDFPHPPALVGGVLEEECAQVLREFFRGLREK